VSCAGKVSIVGTADCLSTIGYVMEEDEKSGCWKIQFEGINGDRMMQFKPPAYRFNIDGKFPSYYQYDDALSDDGNYKIVEYWPIRILLFREGQCKFAFNRYIFNDTTKQIDWNN